MLVFLPGCVSGDAGSDTALTPGEARIVIGTFNVHYISPRQTKMIWEERRDGVVEVLRQGNADIIGFQEMETFVGGHWNDENKQLDWVLAHFPEYAATSVGDPRRYPWTQPILYRKSRFEALEQGFFFFSPHPDQIYSRSWTGGFPAFCSWSRLRDGQSGEVFYVYNLHFDYSNLHDRLDSARLVDERIRSREHKEDPVIALGDFNAPRFFRPVRIVASAGLSIARTRGSTFHFDKGINIQPAIDHVLYSPPFEYRNTRVIREKVEGHWASDHYPVFVTLSLPE